MVIIVAKIGWVTVRPKKRFAEVVCRDAGASYPRARHDMKVGVGEASARVAESLCSVVEKTRLNTNAVSVIGETAKQ